MNKTEIVSLFSGSKGNSVYIRCGNDRILIDAGRSLAAIDKALRLADSRIEEINAVIVTHEHSDHISALSRLMEKHSIPVHMTEKTAAAFFAKNRTTLSTVVTHETEYSINVGSLAVSSFATPHDSADSVGYIIDTGEEKLGYATDMGCPTKEVLEKLSDCKRVIIESNYDEDMLRKGSYPEFLKSRILSKRGHMSNDGCAVMVTKLAERGVSGFVLAHLSENNNLPELALRASCEALSAIGRTDVDIMVASGVSPTRII